MNEYELIILAEGRIPEVAPQQEDTPWYVREAQFSTHPTMSTLGTLTDIPFFS